MNLYEIDLDEIRDFHKNVINDLKESHEKAIKKYELIQKWFRILHFFIPFFAGTGLISNANYNYVYNYWTMIFMSFLLMLNSTIAILEYAYNFPELIFHHKNMLENEINLRIFKIR